MPSYFGMADFEDDLGREDIYKWRERRHAKFKGLWRSYYGFRIFALDFNILRSFFENFNLMMFIQMVFAGVVTYLCKVADLSYDVNVLLFVSPIVFPLAFSINSDFQRRDKVLDDLALFKSAAMAWFFCMRDWKESCGFSDDWMKNVRNKVQAMMFHLREYLVTDKVDRRPFLLRVIYEDISDTNQFNDEIRQSKIPFGPTLVSQILDNHNLICLAFERLCVIRDYRSPRSIRSFTKVVILLLPLLLAPYYNYVGQKISSFSWSPYVLALTVAFVFGTLQGVQDTLDDPFYGLAKDAVNVESLDEWTLQSMEATAHRAYQIGPFGVFVNADGRQVPSDLTPSPLAALSPISSQAADKQNGLGIRQMLSRRKSSGVLFSPRKISSRNWKWPWVRTTMTSSEDDLFSSQDSAVGESRTLTYLRSEAEIAAVGSATGKVDHLAP